MCIRDRNRADLDAGVEGNEGTDGVVGGAGCDDVADHGGAVAKGRRTDFERRLRQRCAHRPHEAARGALVVGDQRAETDGAAPAAVVDLIEPRDAGDVDQDVDVVTESLLELDEQIGATGHDASASPMALEEGERLGEGGRAEVRVRSQWGSLNVVHGFLAPSSAQSGRPSIAFSRSSGKALGSDSAPTNRLGCEGMSASELDDASQVQAIRLKEALAPLLEATGAQVVGPDDVGPGDVEVELDGVGLWVRLPNLEGALDRLMGAVERELGTPLASLSREQKQAAVAKLHQRGAFTLRKSVEDVAAALEVSRFTVYNYLDRIESDGPR